MIQKTSKEVLLHSLQLAGVQNLGFTDFFNTITLVNNEYRKIFEKIASESDGYYDEELIVEGGAVTLPSDIWFIKRVIRMSGDREAGDLQRAPGQTVTSNEYYTRSGTLYLPEGDYKLIYAPQPQTITIPDDPLKTSLDINEIDLNFTGMTEDKFYFRDTQENFFEYDLKTGILEPSTEQYSSNTTYDYIGGTLIVDNINKTYVWERNQEEVMDVYDILAEGKEIDYVVVSEPYIAVTYTDKTIKIFNGWCSADYNIFAYKGKATKGKIIGMFTNDFTGKGVMFLNATDNKIYYASFVPDTILNYPEQADFALLEWKLASILSQQAGTESDWILDNLTEAQANFNSQLMKLKGSTFRVNNVRSSRLF